MDALEFFVAIGSIFLVAVIDPDSLSLFSMVTVAELELINTAWSVVLSSTENISLSSKMTSSMMVICIHSSISPG